MTSRNCGGLRNGLGVLMLVIGPALTSGAQPSVAAEYQVKAEFLVNFLKYVEWPAASGPLVLCVAGQNPFGDLLETIARRERIGGREVVTRVVLEPDAQCTAVFIPKTANRTAYLRAAQAGPTLTVGEAPDFLARGGIINFTEHEGDVRFEISTEAARRANLVISSRLLRLALPEREVR